MVRNKSQDGIPSSNRQKAIAFDVDELSLLSLHEALPNWEIEAAKGAQAERSPTAPHLGAADLLVVRLMDKPAETISLCKLLVASGLTAAAERNTAEKAAGDQGPPTEASRRGAPLLVLVPRGQEDFVPLALKAGAHSCLMLPIHARDAAAMLVHAQAGNQPGRHTLNLERAQKPDFWRDEGGQG